jgi:hypothetical protein
MNITKNKFNEFILILAKKINLEHIYQSYIDDNLTLPELTKYLVYDLFISSYVPHLEPDYEIYSAWENLLPT